MTLHTPVPADVWCVRSSNLASRAIRLGATLRYLIRGGNNDGDLDNHVIIVTHQTDGVWWGVAGRPGGVGYECLTPYLDDPTTITNADQPKGDDQRAQVLACVPQVLKAPYDWTAIMVAAADDLHLPEWFQKDWHGTGAPGHVICSALADWMYHHVGLPNPAPDRFCQPSDWIQFDIDRQWTQPNTGR